MDKKGNARTTTFTIKTAKNGFVLIDMNGEMMIASSRTELVRYAGELVCEVIEKGGKVFKYEFRCESNE